MSLSIVLTALGMGLLVYIMYLYNQFIMAVNHHREALSGIDVQLKRRYDLVPNLVAAVKGYVLHERASLETLVRARQQAQINESADIGDRSQSEAQLSHALAETLRLVEAYPTLKADKLYRDLHQSLIDIEDTIQMARRFYNGTTRDLNIRVQSFPSNLLAKIFGFQQKAFFEFTESRKAVAIDLI